MNRHETDAFVVEVVEAVPLDAALLERLMATLELNQEKAQRLLRRIPGVVTKPISRGEAELIAARFKRLGFRAFARSQWGASPHDPAPTVVQPAARAAQSESLQGPAPSEDASAEVSELDSSPRETAEALTKQTDAVPVAETLDTIVIETLDTIVIDRGESGTDDTSRTTETSHSAVTPPVVDEDSESSTPLHAHVDVPDPNPLLPASVASEPEPIVRDSPHSATNSDEYARTVSRAVEAARRERQSRPSAFDRFVSNDNGFEDTPFTSAVFEEGAASDTLSETPIRLPADFLKAVEREADEVRHRLEDAVYSADAIYVTDAGYQQGFNGTVSAVRSASQGELWQRRLLGFMPALLVLLAMGGYLYQALKPLALEPSVSAAAVAALLESSLANTANPDIDQAAQSLVALQPALRQQGIDVALLTGSGGQVLGGWYTNEADFQMIIAERPALLADLAGSARAQGYAQQVGVSLGETVPAQRRVSLGGAAVVFSGYPLSLAAAPSETILVLARADGTAARNRLLLAALLVGALPLLLWVLGSLFLVRRRTSREF